MPTWSVPTSGARLAALAWETQVRERPADDARIMGYLRAGAIVKASERSVGNSGCAAGWYQIEPAGYVCADKSNATTDVTNDLVRALSRRPDTSATMPYLYGTVRRPGPVYGKLPTREQAEAAEPGYEAKLNEWLGLDGENGASFRADYWLKYRAPDALKLPPDQLWDSKKSDPIPWPFASGKVPGRTLWPQPMLDEVVASKAKMKNGFAFIDTTVVEGRRYAITTQLQAIPVDRLRPIEGSTYKGVEIPRDIDFPFALVRRAGPIFKEEKGKLVKAGDVERRAVLKLTGKQKMSGGRLHYQTADGLWISDKQASRLDPAKRMPKWGSNGERWIDINITKQTLVAYDGTKPVFATLVSTGEAGLEDPEKSRATKRGIFRIHTKHVSATMDSDVVGEEFELRDIPYVQYFEGSYAIHAAYWHDDFGTPRSHGCINMAPEDARRLFFFTEPQVPANWHGVRKSLTGTVVFVHP